MNIISCSFLGLKNESSMMKRKKAILGLVSCFSYIQYTIMSCTFSCTLECHLNIRTNQPNQTSAYSWVESSEWCTAG